MNHRGFNAGDGINFFGFFLIMTIIVIGIVSGVIVFFGKSPDFRQVEANLLSQKVSECFREHDFFEPTFSVSQCDLNADVLAEDHAILVSGDGKEFTFGVVDYVKTQCFVKSQSDVKPVCEESSVEKNGAVYNIVVASNQKPRRIVK